MYTCIHTYACVHLRATTLTSPTQKPYALTPLLPIYNSERINNLTINIAIIAGHGTHVSGLAAGTTYGVAKTATIIPVRIYDCTASGPVSQALDGINYVLTQLTARAPRRAVINMSFGGGSSSILNDAVVRATSMSFAATP